MNQYQKKTNDSQSNNGLSDGDRDKQISLRNKQMELEQMYSKYRYSDYVVKEQTQQINNHYQNTNEQTKRESNNNQESNITIRRNESRNRRSVHFDDQQNIDLMKDKHNHDRSKQNDKMKDEIMGL